MSVERQPRPNHIGPCRSWKRVWFVFIFLATMGSHLEGFKQGSDLTDLIYMIDFSGCHMEQELQRSKSGGREPAGAGIQVFSEVAWPGIEAWEMVGREWTLNIYWNYIQHDLLIKGEYNYEERDISGFELSS